MLFYWKILPGWHEEQKYGKVLFWESFRQGKRIKIRQFLQEYGEWIRPDKFRIPSPISSLPLLKVLIWKTNLYTSVSNVALRRLNGMANAHPAGHGIRSSRRLSLRNRKTTQSLLRLKMDQSLPWERWHLISWWGCRHQTMNWTGYWAGELYPALWSCLAVSRASASRP